MHAFNIKDLNRIAAKLPRPSIEEKKKWKIDIEGFLKDVINSIFAEYNSWDIDVGEAYLGIFRHISRMSKFETDHLGPLTWSSFWAPRPEWYKRELEDFEHMSKAILLDDLLHSWGMWNDLEAFIKGVTNGSEEGK